MYAIELKDFSCLYKRKKEYITALSHVNLTVDPAARQEFRDLVKELHRQLRPTAVFVTHDLTEAFSMAHRYWWVFRWRPMRWWGFPFMLCPSGSFCT